MKAELEKIGMQLNPGTLCADSLLGIRKILHKWDKNDRTKQLRNINKISYVKKEFDAATELMMLGCLKQS